MHPSKNRQLLPYLQRDQTIPLNAQPTDTTKRTSTWLKTWNISTRAPPICSLIILQSKQHRRKLILLRITSDKWTLVFSQRLTTNLSGRGRKGEAETHRSASSPTRRSNPRTVSSLFRRHRTRRSLIWRWISRFKHDHKSRYQIKKWKSLLVAILLRLLRLYLWK